MVFKPENPIVFPPFRLEASDQRLYRNSDPVELRPKAFAVLWHLLQRPGQLVTKDELLETVWPDTIVSDAVLKVCIREIREALADSSARPQFIETAHRRGYRFIGKLSSVMAATEKAMAPKVCAVGRDSELQVLQQALEKAQTGERQILFVTGEPGIGKTTLVDVFLQSLDVVDRVWSARGQCLEQYGEAEAYLPVLEALGRLGRGVGRQSLVLLLRQHAPMWLAQMPALISAETRVELQREIQGATRERMLREMAEAIEALTANNTLVFVLEDLHWSDVSTLDLITRLARRREQARFLLLGTYRPLEVELTDHPLKSAAQELSSHGLCNELALDSLGDAAIGTYLSTRFAANEFPDGLTALIYQRTGGNPLFMINVVDFLTAKGVIIERDGVWRLAVDLDQIETGVPESVRQLIEKQFDRLDRDVQRSLETASVAGVDFATAALAAVTRGDPLKLEELCDDLAQRFHFLKPSAEGDLPDGTLTARYAFTHALYRDVLLQRIGPARRAKLHQAIGEWMEATYADRMSHVAAELAMHFEQAHDYWRAAHYLQQAAENAIVRCANHEAVALSLRGIELLRKLARSSERDRRELKLQITLGIAQIAVHGYATPAVGQTFQYARELCRQFGDVPELFPVLWGLWVYSVVREDLPMALKNAEELLLHSARLQNAELLALAHWTKEATLVNLGDFNGAREHFEKVLEFFDPRATFAAQRYWHDPGVAGRCFGAWALCCLGYPDLALQRIDEALARAREIRHPHVTSIGLFFAAFVHQLRREPERARSYAEELVSLACKEGLAQWIAFGKIVYGWSLAKTGELAKGLAALREGLAACEASNTAISRPHFLSMLAEAQVDAGEISDALATLGHALKVSQAASDRYYESELYRFKGELLLQGWRTRPRAKKQIAAETLSEAEGCFNHAIEIAQSQQSKWFELRAALSLCRLRHEQGKLANCLDLLSPVYDWFTEGFDTPDLVAASEFLRSSTQQET
jgi:DNA-binding winged helix-turn-helix (wHTH) protein/predicted ATPase